LLVRVIDVPSDAGPILMSSGPARSLRTLYVVDPFDGRSAAIHPPAIHIHTNVTVDRPADLIATSNCRVRE
jgi:hypothetical protein